MPVATGQSIAQQIQNIRTHADVLMKIPAGEQFIGPIQSVVSIALTDIARILEARETTSARVRKGDKRGKRQTG